MVATRPLTAADVERMGSAGERMELIDGVLREKAGESLRHGEIEMAILSPLHAHAQAKRNRLGRVYPSPTQFTVLHDPDTVLVPDAAFVRADRVPPEAERWHIAPHAPDLAVEVVSPTDSERTIAERLELYERAVLPLVWVVYPRRRAVEVRRDGQPPVTLFEGDILDGGEVIPGFRLAVVDIFA